MEEEIVRQKCVKTVAWIPVYIQIYNKKKKSKKLGTKIVLKRVVEEENRSGMLKVVPKSQTQAKTGILKYSDLH